MSTNGTDVDATSALRFDGGDVVIKFSSDTTDWILIHSDLVRTYMPVLALLLKPEWGHPASIVHPVTNEERSVYTLTLRFADDTFLLADTTTTCDEVPHPDYARPFNRSELAAQRWTDSEDIFYPEEHTYDYVEGQTGVHHRVLFHILYDIPLDVLAISVLYGPPDDLEGLAKEYEGDWNESLELDNCMRYMVDNVTTLCAYAEYYGCLPKVAPVVIRVLEAHPFLWYSVQLHPGRYLILAQRLRWTRMFNSALRQMVGDPYVAFSEIADCLSITEDKARKWFEHLRCGLNRIVDNIEHELLSLQLCKTFVVWGGYDKPVRTTFFNLIKFRPGRSEGEKANQRSAVLAHSIYGQWFAQQIAGQWIYERDGKLKSKGPAQHPHRVKRVVKKLQEAASSDDPIALFGYKAPERIASIFKLGFRFNPPKQVAATLERLLKRHADHDAHLPHFTYVPLHEYDLPWYHEAKWQESAKLPAAINMIEATDSWITGLGLETEVEEEGRDGDEEDKSDNGQNSAFTTRDQESTKVLEAAEGGEEATW